MREQAVNDLFDAPRWATSRHVRQAMDGLPAGSCACSICCCMSSSRARALDVEIAKLEATGGDRSVIAEKTRLMEQIDAIERGPT